MGPIPGAVMKVAHLWVMAPRFHDLRSRCRSQSQRANACPAGLKAPQLGGLSRGASIPNLCERRRQPEVAVSQNRRHPLSWSRRSRGHRHEAFPLRRRKWCPGQEMTRSTDFMREPSLATAARKTTIDVCTPTGGRPAPPDRNCATGRAGGHFPAMPPYFCRLNQYSPHRGASWEQAERCPRSPRISISGAPHHQQTR